MLYNLSKIIEDVDKNKIKFIYGNENDSNEQFYNNIRLEGSKSYEKLNISSENKKKNNKVNFNDNIKINIYNSTYQKKKISVDSNDSSYCLKDNDKEISRVFLSQISGQDLKDRKFDNEKHYLHLDKIQSSIKKDQSVFGLDFRKINDPGSQPISFDTEVIRKYNENSILSKSIENRSINLEFSPSSSNSVSNDTLNSSSTKINSIKIEPETLDQFQNNTIMTSSKFVSFTSKIKNNEGICEMPSNEEASSYPNFTSKSSDKFFQVQGTSSNKIELLESLKQTENIDDRISSKNVFVEKTEKVESNISSKRDVFVCNYAKRRSSKIGEERYGIEINDVFKKIYNRNKKCVLDLTL
jgi:hypothetical protein